MWFLCSFQTLFDNYLCFNIKFSKFMSRNFEIINFDFNIKEFNFSRFLKN
jgi:hypothetical protein